MSVAEQMKAVVSLGGAVAPSFEGVGKALGKTVVDARGAVRDLNGDQRKLFQTLKQGRKAADDLGTVTQQYEDMGSALQGLESQRQQHTQSLKAQRRERAAIERQIEKAREEGEDVSELTSRHEALTGVIDGQVAKRDKLNKEIFETRKEQNSLNRQMKHLRERSKDVDQLEDQYRDLGNEIGRAERKAKAWEKVGAVAGRVRHRMGQVVAVGGAMVGMSSMLGGLATVTARMTAEQDGLAKAYGMTIEKYKAWGGIASEVGLDEDVTGDLVEELTNKVGEFKALGEQSAVGEVFGSLGLEAAMLEGMDAAEQFEFIMKRLEGVSDDQTAASLADMLMGGEGNKIVTYMRQSGKSLDELLDRHEKFNLLTSAGASGASDYSRSISALFGTVSSAWQEVSGIVGGELAPVIDDLAKSVADFARDNKAELVAGLRDGISVAREFFSGLWEVGQGIATVVGGVSDMVGGVDNLVQIGGVLMAGVVGAKMITGLMTVGSAVGGVVAAMGGLSAIMPAVAVGFKAVGVALMANPIGLAIGALVAAGTALYMNWDSVTGYLSVAVDWISGKFSGFIDGIKAVFGWTPLGMVVNNWEPLSGFFSGLLDGVVETVTSKLKVVKGMLSTVKGWAGKLKFWGDDEPESGQEGKPERRVVDRPSRRPASQGYYDANSDHDAWRARGELERAEQANIAINQAAPSSGGNTVNQRVEKIEVVAAPGQSPEEVGQAVASELGGYHDDALYDIPMG